MAFKQAGSQARQRMLRGCEMCGEEAIGPTNLRRHMHQEGVLSSFSRVEPSGIVVSSQPNKYIRANVMISNLVM